jgi:hypothetical protein
VKRSQTNSSPRREIMKKVALLTILLVVAASATITIEFPEGPPSKVGDSVKVTITASVVVDLAVDSNGTKKPWVTPQTLPPGTNYIEITHPGSGLMLYASKLGDEDYSDPFDVVIGNAERWQIIGPGQTSDPGNAGNSFGKTPDTATVTAGDVETYTVNLCDVWYNVVDPDPMGYTITTDDPFGRVNGNQVELRTAGTWNVVVSGSGYTPDTSKVKVNPGPATQLLIICGGEDGLPGDTAQYGGKSEEPLRASLGTPYPVTILAVDKCWNQADYDDPHVNVYAGSIDLTDTTTDAISGGIADNVQVIFKAVNTSGEYIGAQDSKGLKTAYDTRVFVDPGVDSLVAYFDKPIVPIEVTSTLNIEAYVAGDPLESGFAMVQLVDGPPESFNIGAEGTIDTLVRIIDGKGSIDAWATAETTYTVRVTAGEQTKDLTLTIQELTELVVAPNPYKYGSPGHDAIHFKYKVEEAGAAEVLLLIADPYGNIVYKATYTSGDVVSPGTQEIPWDGTNSKGNRVASGMYQAVVKITLKNLSTEVLKKNFMVIW